MRLATRSNHSLRSGQALCASERKTRFGGFSPFRPAERGSKAGVGFSLRLRHPGRKVMSLLDPFDFVYCRRPEVEDSQAPLGKLAQTHLLLVDCPMLRAAHMAVSYTHL